MYSLFMNNRSRMTIAISSYYTLASLQCRDGARRAFTDQADTVPSAKRREVFGVSREE